MRSVEIDKYVGGGRWVLKKAIGLSCTQLFREAHVQCTSAHVRSFRLLQKRTLAEDGGEILSVRMSPTDLLSVSLSISEAYIPGHP